MVDNDEEFGDLDVLSEESEVDSTDPKPDPSLPPASSGTVVSISSALSAPAAG